MMVLLKLNVACVLLWLLRLNMILYSSFGGVVMLFEQCLVGILAQCADVIACPIWFEDMSSPYRFSRFSRFSRVFSSFLGFLGFLKFSRVFSCRRSSLEFIQLRFERRIYYIIYIYSHTNLSKEFSSEAINWIFRLPSVRRVYES